MTLLNQIPKGISLFSIPILGVLFWFISKEAFLGAFALLSAFSLVIITCWTLHRPKKFFWLFTLALTANLIIPFIAGLELRFYIGILMVIVLLPTINRLHVRKELQGLHSFSQAMLFLMLALLPFDQIHFELYEPQIGVDDLKWLGIAILPVALLTLNLTNKFIEQEFEKLENSKVELIWLSTFFNLFSHNIRTPFSAIQSIKDLISLKLQRSETKNFEFMEPLLDRLQTATDEGTLVVNTLLSVVQRTYSFEKLGNKELQLSIERTNNDLFHNCTSQHHLYTEAEFVSILMSMEIFINNARKHSSQITIEYGDRYIHVLDKGMGMSESSRIAYSKKVLTEVGQIDISGIGVYYAKKLLETNGLHAFPNTYKGDFCMTIDTKRTPLSRDLLFSTEVGNRWI